jgi:hypothetical protein
MSSEASSTNAVVNDNGDASNVAASVVDASAPPPPPLSAAAAAAATAAAAAAAKMSDQAVQRRAQIMQIMRDTSLSMQEKSKRVQVLMSAKFEAGEAAARAAVSATTRALQTTVTHHKDSGELGCNHYKRGCKIEAACCGELFGCRLCHDDHYGVDHKIDRFATQNVFCMRCATLGPVGEKCSNVECGERFARYFCASCKFYDDERNRAIYHCNDCGMCRRGQGLGVDFYHCHRCDMCVATAGAGDHVCVEQALKRDCPMCGVDLFTSIKPVQFMPCGHAVHSSCLNEMLSHEQYTCPGT